MAQMHEKEERDSVTKSRFIHVAQPNTNQPRAIFQAWMWDLIEQI